MSWYNIVMPILKNIVSLVVIISLILPRVIYSAQYLAPAGFGSTVFNNKIYYNREIVIEWEAKINYKET